MSRSFEVRDRVRSETKVAASWYDDRFAEGGFAFTLEVGRVLNAIREYPDAYTRVRGNVRRTHLRRFPYLVFFRVRPEVVEVLLLIHAARDPQVWLEVLGDEGWE